MKPITFPAALACTLAACGTPPSTTANSMTSAGATEPATDNAASAPSAAGATNLARNYTGRWIGVEGMNLLVTNTGPDTVTLQMQYDLDNKGRFPATVTEDGLRFTRNGVAEVARPSDGNATGLKWLAGKKDCLTVKPGEGYCRA